jgi:hypothetical protein
MYVEGLEQEELIIIEDSAIPLWTQDPLLAPDDDYRAMGLTVIDGG